MRFPGILILCSLIAVMSPLFAQSPTLSTLPSAPGGVADQVIRIREAGIVKVPPDTLYLLMKTETEGAQLGQAIEQNRKAVDGFVDALKRLGINKESIRQTNFVVSRSMMGTGTTYARNVVITIPAIDQKTPGEITQLMARVQDLGARFGSNCITCIGSG
ncbi:MAG: SIMPL domain-containing protein [Terriglobia bacterium]